MFSGWREATFMPNSFLCIFEEQQSKAEKTEEILSGQHSFFDIDREIGKLSQRFSSRSVLSNQDVNGSGVVNY